MPNSPIAAVILAAGMGSRMKSGQPKVIHAVAGRPMIGHVLETAGRLKAERVAVVIGPDMEDLAQAVHPHPTVVQSAQDGTGGAVKAAREALAGFSGTVLVLYGDTPLMTEETLRRMLAARAADPAPMVVVLGFRPADPGLYGRLVTQADGTLEAIVEARDATPDQLEIGLCNSGVMAVDGAALFDLLDKVDNKNAKQEYYLTDIVG
ncbi:MAG: NTP transferase domain-containing protein, partial [bacterium]|nr:NTP transferase domain-containing protein [bacterium]